MMNTRQDGHEFSIPKCCPKNEVFNLNHMHCDPARQSFSTEIKAYSLHTNLHSNNLSNNSTLHTNLHSDR